MRGRLLVATSAIESGVFWRSVVYLIEHDADGALGVIVNRPLDADVDDVLPDWVDSVISPGCLFEGGPVAADAALALGILPESPPSDPPGWRRTDGLVGLVDLDAPPPAAGDFRGVRVFAGYAGWGPGQLEDEVAESSWMVVAADPEDLLSPHPDTLWRQVLRRQQDDLRFWSTYPDDPHDN